MAGLVSGEVEADHAVTHVAAGDLCQRDVLRGWHVPQRRDDHATLESERLSAGGPAAQHGTNHVCQRETLLHVQPRSVANLGVTDVVALQVLAELVGGSLE